MNETLNQVKELQCRINKSIIGQEGLVERILISLLANGNLLLEGLPGLAKTRAVKSLAKEIDAKLTRIQFTPDLLPSDVTGSEIYQPELEEKFVFQAGPIFSNLVLADEINRAPAKVQSALLEAMEERQVSVAGKTYKMDPLFMVLATQNPVEQEGTYPLPEAQLDRFLMNVLVDYPSSESEKKVLRLVRSENKSTPPVDNSESISQDVIFDARKQIEDIEVSDAVEQYIVDLINASRHAGEYQEDLGKLIDFGASPRGTIAIDSCARAYAWLNGRNYVTPDDVRAIVHDVLRHRLILSYEASASGVDANTVIDKLLEVVAVA
ncbi:MAG: AAA family ATPase [Mangrovibacterium sp.]